MAKAAKKAAKKAGKSRAEKDKAARTKSATKGTKKVKASEREPSPGAGRKLPNANQLKTVLADVEAYLDRAGTQTGKMRERIAEAKRDINLNPVAFGMIRRLIRTGKREPNALMVLLEDFDHMRAVLKVDDMAGTNMFKEDGSDDDHSDEGQPEGDGDEETEVGGDNVHQLPSKDAA